MLVQIRQHVTNLQKMQAINQIQLEQLIKQDLARQLAQLILKSVPFTVVDTPYGSTYSLEFHSYTKTDFNAAKDQISKFFYGE